MNILDRFLKYISIDTTSSSKNDVTPSTYSQKNLALMLVEELNDLNLDQVHYDAEHCYVYGVLKGNPNLTKVGFVSHLDTSENAKGSNINPNIIENYNGEDIFLNENVVLKTDVYPDLKKQSGKTLITTDGTTLLGADDKAGIAEIMCMLDHFTQDYNDHGDIYVCFTPDEEIGNGTKFLNKDIFCPDVAYTVDGSNLGEFSYENFNAASATIDITGVPVHCGIAKDIMINAVHIATIINSLLPDELPENTENYDGFFHLEEISGDVAHATMKYLIRDFDKDNFEMRKEILSILIEKLNDKYKDSIKLEIKDTYRNMYEVMHDKKEIINSTIDAIKNAGITPEVVPIRGGCDGTDISFSGIPCPNLGTGGHNFHSVYEYISLEDMENVTMILISIVNEFSKNKKNHIKHLGGK